MLLGKYFNTIWLINFIFHCFLAKVVGEKGEKEDEGEGVEEESSMKIRLNIWSFGKEISKGVNPEV